MNELQFKEWLGEDHWKALKYALKKGKKAYLKKRKEQIKPPEKKQPVASSENLHKWLTERRIILTGNQKTI